MSRRPLIYSILLHVTAFILLAVNFTFWHTELPPPASSAPIIVDLKNIQISDKTNLPPPIKAAPKKPAAAAPATPPPPPKSIPAPVRPIEKPLKDAAPVIEKIEKAAPEPAPTKKTPPPAKQPVSPTAAQSELRSLLASVDQIKKPRGTGMAPTGPVSNPTPDKMENQGIEGGTEGDYAQPLTISERDLIASKLRGCWNVDAGVEGIEDMIVEVKVQVDKDGSVKDVRILNMKNSPTFRSVAESARRAVYICDAKKDESPFRILAEKYGDKYNSWREVIVRFSPLQGVF